MKGSKESVSRTASLIACSTKAAITKQKIYFSLSSQKAQKNWLIHRVVKNCNWKSILLVSWYRAPSKEQILRSFLLEHWKKMYFVLKETVIETAKR